MSRGDDVKYCEVILFLSLAAAACGSGSGLSVPPEVEQAMAQARNLDTTYAVIRSSGSYGDMLRAMPATFPALQTLVTGSGDTRAALLEAFGATGTVDNDMELALYAAALERIGDTSALQPLKDFLARNVTSASTLARHFVTHAIRALEGRHEEQDDECWYFTDQMLDAATLPALALTQESALDAKKVGSDCGLKWEIWGPDGQTVYYTGADGKKVKAMVGGEAHACKDVPKQTFDRYTADVQGGGGTYVDDDPTYPGMPQQHFNCAGYAFREFNGKAPMTAGPDGWWRVMTKTGYLEEIPLESAVPGDFLFYWRPTATEPGHVAVVKTAAAPGQKVTVRNADGQSGLWEAPYDAPYFLGRTSIPPIAVTYDRYKAYRWKDGRKPVLVPESSSSSDPNNCVNVVLDATKCHKITGEPGPNVKYGGRIFLGTTPSGEPGSLGMGLFRIYPDEGQYDMVSPRPIDGVAVSPNGKLLAVGYLNLNDSPPYLAMFDISDTAGVKPLDGVFQLTPGVGGNDQLTGPAFVTDDLLVVSHVGDLRMYRISEKKGSLKVASGWRSTASPGTHAMVVETDSGLRGIMDVTKSTYKNYDPWDLDPTHIQFQDEDPTKVWAVKGGEDGIAPKFSPDGKRLAFLRKADKTVVHDARLTVGGEVTDDLTYAGPGGKIGAVAWSPDGKWLAFAVLAAEGAGGGVWVMEQGKWSGQPVKLLGANLANTWIADMAWSP
jgi:hypothetical protein